MMIVTKGKMIGVTALVFLPIFIVTGAAMFLEGVQKGQAHDAVMGLVVLLFFGACGLLALPSKKYVPAKIFWLYRNKKFSTQKAINYGYGIIIIFLAVFMILSPKQMIQIVVSGLAALYGLYVFSKSLKFHADVDFSTNEYLANALGFPVGEKILVSYQNFDADDVEVGSNAFAATATRLVLASFDGRSWKKLSRDLDQISHIGIIGNENQSYFVKFIFNDGVDALLFIGLYEKLTSNPVLVVRKLLEAIDASLLGTRGAPLAASRRRVAVNPHVPDSTSSVVAPETAVATAAPARNIELTSDVLTAIQNAEEFVPGRRLEL